MNLVEELKAITFEKAPFGYRVEEVDRYIDRVGQAVSELERDNEDLEAKLEILAAKLEEYRQDEESMRSALIGAQKLGDSVVRDSKAKAEELLRESQEKSEELLRDSKAKAEEIVRDAMTRAEQTIGSIKQQAEQERSRYEIMQLQVSDFRNKLIELYKSHIEMINMLPEYEGTEPPTPPAAPVNIAPVQTAPTPEPEPPKAPEPKAPPMTHIPDFYKDDLRENDLNYGSAPSAPDLAKEDDFQVELPDEKPTGNTPYQRYVSKYGELLFGDDIDVR